MNDKYILKKDHLTSFLRKLQKEYRLVAPIRNNHGDTLFQPVSSLDEDKPDLDVQPQNSIKQFFFPQQETLFRYENTTTSYEFKSVHKKPPPTVYFAVRPCDLSALLYMDVIFLKGIKDSQYREKREDALIIGLNCNTPFENCFCNAMKSGPFIEYGFDLQLTDLGDYFMVEVGRTKGEQVVSKWIQFFSPAEDNDVNSQYQVFLEARGSFRLQVHVDQAVNRLAEGLVPEKVWHDLSLRCQDCGGCAYVCPTCTCFTITDRRINDEVGERLRSWDACTLGGFTRMAGDHNPVNKKTDAIRQRFMHKLAYDVKQHGRPSCVGCGRCVGICFGGTDIVRFIQMASE